MKSNSKSLIVVMVVFLAAVAGLRAEEDVLLDGGAARFEALVESLDLSDEQAEEVKAILSEGAADRKKVLEESGYSEDLSRKEKFKTIKQASPDLKAIRTEMDESLAEILSDEQMEAYQKARSEMKQNVKKSFKERRKEM